MVITIKRASPLGERVPEGRSPVWMSLDLRAGPAQGHSPEFEGLWSESRNVASESLITKR